MESSEAFFTYNCITHAMVSLYSIFNYLLLLLSYALKPFLLLFEAIGNISLKIIGFYICMPIDISVKWNFHKQMLQVPKAVLFQF